MVVPSSSSALQWLSLVTIIWLQSVSGTNTNFSAYSSQLKNLLSMSQLQLNNLALASDAGKLFGFFSGIASIHFPLWLVLLIGSTLGLVGYGVQYLFLTNCISSLSYPHIFILTVLAGNGISWINTVCYVVTIRNFPSDRQLAIGLTTSYQGLSAKIYTVIVDAFFLSSPSKRAKSYLLLNSTLPLLVCVMSAPLVRDINVENGMKMRIGFMVLFVITISTGVYAVISSLGLSGLPALGNAVGIFLFLVIPLVIPMAVKIREVVMAKLVVNREAKLYHFTAEENNSVDIERMENNSVDIERMENNSVDIEIMENNSVKEGEEIREEKELVGVNEEIGVKEMLRRLNFWLYFMVYLMGAALGLVYLNNLGQIAESRGYSRTSSLVSLSSSLGFFGRLMPSLVDYFFSRSKHLISRPASIAALMAPMAGAFFLLVDKSDMSLYISTAIICICTGAVTSISVSTTTELFGTKNFAINHSVLVANIPIGSFIFGSISAIIYHKEGDGLGKCIGIKCYRNTFIIWGSLCFVGTLLAVILHSRLRKFY